jgi:effector-binding domain-containing protein
MLNHPEVIQTDERLTATIHLTIPRAEIGLVMGPAIAEVLAALAAQGIEPVGPCFSFHPQRPTEIFDFAVGFPVNAAIIPVGRVKPGKLPAVTTARMIYQGGYDGLAAAWGDFCLWIETEGLTAQDSLWECYLVGPESSPNPADWRTELNRPLSM